MQNFPVYEQKAKILQALQNNQVIIVESPTGSGKTTQLPIILYEAGYTQDGLIGVTQPRRIATLSVCSFIANQLASPVGDLIGYKMRFEDNTGNRTRLKIMTDGMLLQELKHDPLLSNYNVIIIDEAHERSLNIDFILGLLKSILRERPSFKVVISSATINSAIFSNYFNFAPVINISAQMYPVAIIYDPIPSNDDDLLTQKINDLCEHIILEEERAGDILIFLPGEKLIKQVIKALNNGKARHKIWTLPLYGMLGKEEQERVFLQTEGKVKIVVSTNIAETSITIDGVTTVIDSGRCKENRYNLNSYTSSLIDTTISKASAGQRRGRAGRTRAGFCYRLYSKESFESWPDFTLEEIYRTDLAEVVLRMAGLEIKDYTSFDFISKPNVAGIKNAVETLILLGALDNAGTLTNIGQTMLAFPLLPRHSRIMVEAMLSYPDVLSECAIVTAFLSTNSPFLLPPDEEEEARFSHQSFKSDKGDFMSYLNLYAKYEACTVHKRTDFCGRYYLDQKTMDEIVNVKGQLEEIAGRFGLTINNTTNLNINHLLICCAKGLIQFICIKDGKNYRSLTADRIIIHPSSNLFHKGPLYIVAGDIMRTSRTYARTVSPLTKEILNKVDGGLIAKLESFKENKAPKEDKNYLTIGRLQFPRSEIASSYPKKKYIITNKQNFNELIQNLSLLGKLYFKKSKKNKEANFSGFITLASNNDNVLYFRITQKFKNYKDETTFNLNQLNKAAPTKASKASFSAIKAALVKINKLN
ncbi:MAG: ATP-dependent RNA helicase [Spirochaetaceae bacterium]|nr:ATP-dependent RNA helicase [Spirochaetaceae bacterium]